MLFEHRHKEYGAYDLRQRESQHLRNAFIIGVAFILLVTLGVFLYNAVLKKSDNKEISVDVTLVDVDIPDIPEEEEPEEEEPEPEPEPEPEVAQVNAVMPEPKKDVEVEEPPAKQSEMEDKQIGVADVEGEATTTSRGTTVPEPSEGTGTKPSPAPPKNYTARQVTKMAVYPGCEKFRNDKNKLTDCMSSKLKAELVDQLSDFPERMNDKGESKAVARLQFVIDRSGHIIDIRGQGAGGGINNDLSIESEKAMQRISSRMKSRGRAITPAQLEDGTPANVVIQLPVVYLLE